jgi:hypothetical protein
VVFRGQGFPAAQQKVGFICSKFALRSRCTAALVLCKVRGKPSMGRLMAVEPVQLGDTTRECYLGA